MLEVVEERELARRWREESDTRARDRLVHSHLRLVIRIANNFRGYGRPIEDFVSAGCIGLLKAVERFDPDRGARLSTYATWWIRAAIQAEAMRTWSLVKIGTTVAEKKLFFGLRRAKGALRLIDDGNMSEKSGAAIAEALGVPRGSVIDMDRRLAYADQSLNAKLDSEGETEWQDMLTDPGETPEAAYAAREEFEWRHRLMTECLDTLNDREREILTARHLGEKPVTLRVLGQSFGISCERVRQIEARAMEKLGTAMKIAAARETAAADAS